MSVAALATALGTGVGTFAGRLGGEFGGASVVVPLRRRVLLRRRLLDDVFVVEPRDSCADILLAPVRRRNAVFVVLWTGIMGDLPLVSAELVRLLVLKRRMHFVRTRYIGLLKNAAHLLLLAIAYNMRRVVALTA